MIDSKIFDCKTMQKFQRTEQLMIQFKITKYWMAKADLIKNAWEITLNRCMRLRSTCLSVHRYVLRLRSKSKHLKFSSNQVTPAATTMMMATTASTSQWWWFLLVWYNINSEKHMLWTVCASSTNVSCFHFTLDATAPYYSMDGLFTIAQYNTCF